MGNSEENMHVNIGRVKENLQVVPQERMPDSRALQQEALETVEPYL